MQFTIKDLPKTLVKAASALVVLFVIAASSTFSWLITSARIADTVARGMMAISSNPFVLVLLINVLLLFLGRSSRLRQSSFCRADPDPLRCVSADRWRWASWWSTRRSG